MTTNLNLRLPTELHRQLKAKAAESNASLNTYLVMLLAGGIGFEDTEQGRARDADTPEPTTAQGGNHEQHGTA